MNAATKVMIQESLFPESISTIKLSKEHLAAFALSVLVLLSAFAVVYVKNQERFFFSEAQSLQRVYETKQVEYGQLLLEQSSWSTPARIQRIAQQRLRMEVPTASRVVLKKL